MAAKAAVSELQDLLIVNCKNEAAVASKTSYRICFTMIKLSHYGSRGRAKDNRATGQRL